MRNKRIDLTQFEKDEYDDRFYRVEACIGDYTRYMYEDESDIRLSKQLNLLPKLIDELKRCYEELDRPKVTIDDWDKAGPCVTVYLEGKEYVGILREYDASE